MRVANGRNYWIALVGCLSVTLLSWMGKDNLGNWQWHILSDLNVAIWLFVAWLFDDCN